MRRALSLLCFALVLAAAPALAQRCNLADPQKVAQVMGSYDGALAVMKERSCIGDPDLDTAELVKEFNELLKSGAAEERLASSITALKMLARRAANRASGARGDDWNAISAALTGSAQALAEISEETNKAEAIRIAERAIPRSWGRIDPRTANGTLVFNGRPVPLLSATGCSLDAPPCEAFNNQLEMIRVVNLGVRLRDVTQWDSLQEHLQDARLQTGRWDAYRTKGQHQYFWEVYVNGLTMGEKLCPKDPATGIQRGFCAVPTSQWIVLHPEAGLRWVRTANESSELKAAFIVELLGYYRWDWKSEKSAEMKNNFGASIVAAYSDVDTGRKWSYGPMIHFGNGYNLAATKASGEKWSILISVNLAERYFGRKKEYTDYLKALDKPGFGALLQ